MIPKIIHYVWLGKEMPEKNKELIRQWQEICPDYKFMLWNEKNFDIAGSVEYVKQAYKNKKYAFVADYIRLFALKTYGGIYLDTDVMLLKNFDDMLDTKLFIGRETSAYLCTAVIGAEKNNKDISNMLDSYQQKQFVKEDGSLDTTTNVVYLSAYFKQKYGYSLKIEKQQFGEDLTIYPVEEFSSLDYITRRSRKTESPHAIHLFDCTWNAQKKSWKKMAKACVKLLPKNVYFCLLDKFKNHQFKKHLKTINDKK